MKIKHLILLAIGIMMLTGATAPAQAKSGFLDFFFPSMRKYDPDPTKTLKAPFALDAEQEGEVDLETYRVPTPDDTVPMHKQHRINAEISTWLAQAITESLAFHVGAYQDNLKTTEKYFTPEGRDQYLAFLDEFGVMKVLLTGRYATSSFLKSDPVVLNQGEVGGYYKWLMRVPATLSFFEGNSRNYKDLKVFNQEVEITIQVGRRPDVPVPGVLIESWTAKAIEDDTR